MKHDTVTDLIQKALEKNVTALDLSSTGITSLPPEIFELRNLLTLNLTTNQLTTLPPEIVRLGNLQTLFLGHNQLIDLPPEIAQLSNLKELYLHFNQLTALPSEILKLRDLTSLTLGGNRFSTLPSEVVDLKNLTRLNFDGHQITSLPYTIVQLSNLRALELRDNHLVNLIPEFAQLSNLKYLSLDGNQLTNLPLEIIPLRKLKNLSLDRNQLTNLPPEFAHLSNLEDLSLRNNQLTNLPPEITHLRNLKNLSLDENQLTNLPPEIIHLRNLKNLSLDDNQLTNLSSEIVQLGNLEHLSLRNNRLTNLPPEIIQLSNLEYLSLDGNQLTDLPPEIIQLSKLELLSLRNNQLITLSSDVIKIRGLNIDQNPFTKLPPEIVEQGSKIIIEYLQEIAESGESQWVSKLMLVGEGGVGKTSLLRALRGEPFVKGEVTTRGIEIHPLTMAHPEHLDDVKVTFNAWDFGGQEIYHATHQFFLTNRSLFLLLWNARAGYEQGKLYYWLDAIQSRAPQSPVLIVATHTAERSADLPIAELKNRFPQIIDAFSIDNENGDGIPKLRAAIEKAAATSLPLMGEKWPASWLNAVNEVRSRNEKHITPENLHTIFESHKVSKSSVPVLERWLHELGDILYFRDESELNDLVVLKPSWVTQYISRVLDSDDVVGKEGIFTNTHMANLWSDLDPSMRQHFLRLMEKFDLSYRTLDNQEVSLIVERLPLDPPDLSVWEELAKTPHNEISMKFKLSSVLPGIPTWFIAREHRFTTHTHWRMGALFKRDSHYALVQAFPHDRYVQITVRGSRPHEFFTLLRDGLETTFKRYPGLKIERVIPCTGHDGQPCSYEFSFENLEKAIEREKPIDHIQCQQSFDDVSVPELLFGLHWRTQDKVLEKIDELKSQMTAQNNELVKLVQREFAKNFRREQAMLESYCPSVFVLRPYSAPEWSHIAFGAKMELQLYCQAPGCWHPTQDSGKYIFDAPPGWLRMAGKHIVNMVKFLKYVIPLAGPWASMASAEYAKLIANDIKMMEELVKLIPDVSDLEDTTKLKLAEGITRSFDNSEELIEQKENPYLRYDGSPLRAMRLLLDELDKQQHWGGLQRILTPEDDYLWLCEYHAKEYRY